MLRERIRSTPLLVGAAVGIATLGLYLTTLAPTLTWGWDDLGVDGGEFLAAANTFGVPHPPGYPTYTLLLKLFATVVPVGDFAYRGNLLSAVLGAATATLLYWAILRICTRVGKGGPDWLRVLGFALGAATFATSPLFWSQANVTEVYTLNTFLAASLLLIATYVVFDSGADHRKRLAIFGLVLGLGLGNHLTLLAVAVPLLLWVWSAVGGWTEAVAFHLAGWRARARALGLHIPSPSRRSDAAGQLGERRQPRRSDVDADGRGRTRNTCSAYRPVPSPTASCPG